MPIPAEVQYAQSVLAGPPKFGDDAQVRAAAIMKRWKKAECVWCNGKGRRITRLDLSQLVNCPDCGGTGQVWVRR